MRKILLAVTLIFSVVLVGCGSPSSEVPYGDLFNGKDLDGWVLFVPDESVDVNSIWTVKDGVVHCSGVPNGYMRTEHKYSNYILSLEWRWPGEPTNSGVLLHCQLPDKVWPVCIEAQIKAGNAGDFVIMGHSSLTVKNEVLQNDERWFVVAPRWLDSSEKQPGQWNRYDIVCRGDEIQLRVNGALQNVGRNASLSEGYIALQSEGGPIEFRNIYIKSID